MFINFFFFFFSSRRRHTRFDCDWSSDVCSSDLVFYAMSPADLAAILVELAQGVRLQAFRKSPRRPKKPHPQGKKPARKGHVSTAKLLMNRKANLVAP